MRIYCYSPKLIGRACYGIYEVTATYWDGRIDVKEYKANTTTEAVRKYLFENGKMVRAELKTKLKKPLDRSTQM